jgi:hypothetical protein
MSAVPIYVVVCQNDKAHPRFGVDPHGAIVHETYVKDGTLQLQQARAGVMERWGACRLARLVFEDRPGHAQDMLDALRQWRAAEATGDAAELENARAARDAAIAAATGAA